MESCNKNALQEKKSLSDLPNECLQTIFGYLSLKDQHAVKLTSRRLESIIKDMWIRQNKEITLSMEYPNINKFKSNYYAALMETITTTLRTISLDQASVKQLRVLGNLTFPNVKAIRGNLRTTERINFTDRDTFALSQIFPNLEEFAIVCNISGKYLWLFKNLKELDLSYCKNLNSMYLQRIFLKLKLKKLSVTFYDDKILMDHRIGEVYRCSNLVELKIDDQHLLFFMDELLCMPYLKSLLVHTHDFTDFALEGIAESDHNKRMKRMIFNNVIWDENRINQLRVMINLEVLILIHIGPILTSETLNDLSEHLKRLRELHIVYDRIQYENALIGFMKNCPLLELIHINNTNCGSNLLNCIAISIRKWPPRKKALHIVCYQTGISTTDVEDVNFSNGIVKIRVDDPPKFDFIPNSCFKCEWTPLKIPKKAIV